MFALKEYRVCRDKRNYQQDTILGSLLFQPGTLGRITIHPGRTMKVIGTVTGPLKKYIGEL